MRTLEDSAAVLSLRSLPVEFVCKLLLWETAQELQYCLHPQYSVPAVCKADLPRTLEWFMGALTPQAGARLDASMEGSGASRRSLAALEGLGL
eukprot:8955514-Alexandrium_andersonii.AAC.1